MNMIAIPAHQVEWLWPDICSGMERLFKQSLGLFNAEDIRDNCAKGQWLLFCMFEDGEPVVSIVVEIREGEQRVFDVGFCWGTRLDDWIDDVYSNFVRIARECGCDAIAFKGRPGWRKLAQNFGFTINSMTYVKGLT